MKAQVEFFVILGLLFLVVAVVFWGYMGGWFGSEVPESVATKQAAITTSFEQFMRDGAYDAIERVSENGGYLDESEYVLGSVEFAGDGRPYWQYFGQTAYPRVLDNVRTAFTEYVEENRDTFFEAFESMELVVGEISAITLTEGNNKVRIDIHMPLSIVVDDVEYAFQQPFSAEVQTDIAQIEDFAEEFTYSQANDRLFETFTMASVLLSPYDSEPPASVQEVPVFIMLDNCGQSVFRSWFDIQPEMDELLRETVANTYMPNKSPQGNIEMSSAPDYEIPVSAETADASAFRDYMEELAGSHNLDDDIDIGAFLDSMQYAPAGLNSYYSDLDVWFDVPDDFELTQLNFQFTPNPIFEIAEPVPLTSVCLSDPVYISYYLTYPLVVNVRDSTGSVFSFAHTVYIYDNSEGQWAVTPGGYDPSVQQEICSGARCPVKVTVEDSEGEPIEGASVSYIGCPLGKTDSDGVVEATAPCGTGTLAVYMHGYAGYEDRHVCSTLSDKTVALTRMPYKRVRIYEVNINYLSETDTYVIAKDAVGLMNTEFNPNYLHGSTVANLYVSSDERYPVRFTGASGELNYIPAGEYSVVGLLSDDGYTANYGGFMMSYTLSEDDGDLYIYMPYITSFADISDEDEEEQQTEMVKLYSLLSKCGLGPISETGPDSFDGCSKEYNEL